MATATEAESPRKGMLVLSRRLNESIVIGNDIEVTVTQIKGGAVRLGVSAPREMPVHRKEVRRRIDEEAA